MKKLSSIAKSITVVALAGAAVYGGLAASALARPPFQVCTCPHVYAPVLCPNGQVYSNSCFAGCEGQTGCVPYEDWF